MKIRNVAAIVSGMDEEYPYQIILGINRFAKEHSVNVSYFVAFGGIIDSKEFDIGEYSIYKLPDFSEFDGIILMSNTFSDPVIRNAVIDKVKASKTPTVIFECKDHEEFCDISIDNYSVMKKLVEHLIVKHEARTFCYISGPEANPEAEERYRAFRDTLSEYGIEFDDNRLFKGLFRSYDGTRAIAEFQKSGLSLPDAFVCANDSMALAAMSQLQAMGYHIPEDVIVTGFDYTFNAQNSCPVLTTVKRPLFFSGEKACSVLWNLMNGIPQEKSTPLDAEPVFTESCGCYENRSIDFSEFRKNTYLRIERTYMNVHMMNRLIAGLAGAENIDECIGSIENMLDMISCDNFSLCLTENWENTYNIASLEENSEVYPPTMTAPYILENGKRLSEKSFPSCQLRPVPLTTGGNISYYIPLHYDQRCLGYYIITNNDFPILSLLCHTLSMCIGNAIDKISKLNVIDPLCKIYNRNGFEKNAAYIFKECISTKSVLSICFVDMNGLKAINDTFGHKEGDFAIKCIADAISSSCTSADICGRFGGDEFVILGKEEDFAERFKNNFSFKISELNEKLDKPYKITASIGYITTIPRKSDKLLDLIQKADAEMYEQKKSRHLNRI